jgi:hypothetical protein
MGAAVPTAAQVIAGLFLTYIFNKNIILDEFIYMLNG